MVNYQNIGIRMDQFSMHDPKCLKAILQEYSVQNFEQLVDLLNSGELNSHPGFSEVQNYILDMKSMLADGKHINVKERVKTFSLYQSSNLPMTTLEKTDHQNCGGVLMLSNPATTLYRGFELAGVEQMSIAQLKYYLSHCDFHGEMLFTKWRYIGTSKVDLALEALSLFEKQNIRLLKEVGSVSEEVNLFTVDLTKRKNIVQEEKMELFDYLFEQGDTYVFGTLTDHQKEMLNSGLINSSKASSRKAQQLLNYLSYYVTPKEAERGLVKSKTLDRFIVQ